MKKLSFLFHILPFCLLQNIYAQEVAHDPFPGFEALGNSPSLTFGFSEQGPTLYGDEYIYDSLGTRLYEPRVTYFLTNADKSYSLGMITDYTIGSGLVVRNNISQEHDIIEFENLDQIPLYSVNTCINDTFYFITRGNNSTKLFYLPAKTPIVQEVKDVNNQSFNNVYSLITFNYSLLVMHGPYKHTVVQKGVSKKEVQDEASFNGTSFSSAGLCNGTVSPKKHSGIYYINAKSATFKKIIGDSLELRNDYVVEYKDYLYFNVSKPFSFLKKTAYRYSIKSENLEVLQKPFQGHLIRKLDDHLILMREDTMVFFDGTAPVKTTTPLAALSAYSEIGSLGKHYILTKDDKYFHLNLLTEVAKPLKNTGHIKNMSRVVFHEWGIVFNGRLKSDNKEAIYFYRYGNGQLDSVVKYNDYNLGAIKTLVASSKGLFISSSIGFRDFGVTQSSDNGKSFSAIPDAAVSDETHWLYPVGDAVVLVSADEVVASSYPYNKSGSIENLKDGRVDAIINDTLYYSTSNSLFTWDGSSQKADALFTDSGPVYGLVKTKTGIFAFDDSNPRKLQFINSGGKNDILKDKYFHVVLAKINGKALIAVSKFQSQITTDELWLCDGIEANNELIYERPSEKNYSAPMRSFSRYRYKNMIPVYWRNDSGSYDLCLINGETGEVTVHETTTEVPRMLGVIGSKLILAADDGKSGKEPYAFDIKNGRLKLLSNIFPGTLSSNPDNSFSSLSYPTYLGTDKFVFFTAYNFENGYAIWKTDGTTAGTWLYSSIDNPHYLRPENLTVHKDYLYFTGVKDFENNYVVFKVELDFDALTISNPRSNTKELSLFPNPAHTSISINQFDVLSGQPFKVYSQSGQVVLQSTLLNPSIDISELQPGIYLFEMTGKDTPYRSIFVKNY